MDDRIDEKDLYRRLSNRWFIWGLAAFGLLVCLLGGWLLRLEFYVPVTGEVVHSGEREIYSPEAARLEESPPDDGRKIAEGEVLLHLSSPELESELLALRRELDRLENELELQKTALERWEVDPARAEVETSEDRLRKQDEILATRREILKMLKGGGDARVVSKVTMAENELEMLEAEMERVELQFLKRASDSDWAELEKRTLRLRVEGLRSELRTAKENAELLRRRTERLKLRAPFSGYVSRIDVDFKGERVEAGEFLLTLVPEKTGDRVRAYAPERNIDLVEPGTPVRLEPLLFDATFEGYIHGSVEKVGSTSDPEASEAAGAARYQVDIAIKESPYPIKLGASVSGRVILGKRGLLQSVLGLGRGGGNQQRSEIHERRGDEAQEK